MASSLSRVRHYYLEYCTKSQGGGGEPQSIEELLVSNEFYPIMRSMFGPIAAAMKLPLDRREDVLQEVCLAIVEYLGRHDKGAIQRWRGWVQQVMRHKAVDDLRRLRPGGASLDALAMDLRTPESEETDIDRERHVWMAEQLEEMPDDESLNGRLLRGRFVEGRTNAELAAGERLTQKAVESRICRMVWELRQKATEDGLMAPSQESSSLGEKTEKSEKVAREFGISSD